jgi:hydroxyacylglutathione hydrolase
MKILRLKLTNCYLVPIDSKYLLVDTGYEWEWDTFQKGLNELNVKISDIDYLLLTHHHDDHSGLITNLIEINPKIRIILHQLCSEYLKLGKHVHPSEFWHMNKRISIILSIKAKFDKKWTHSFPIYNGRESDIIINSDTNLKDIGVNLKGRIIETPGHSLDQIALILDNGICICGDSASNFLHFAGLKYGLISIDNWDYFYQSWDKIIDSNVNKIYPAHGESFDVIKLKKNLRKNKKENMVLYKGN